MAIESKKFEVLDTPVTKIVNNDIKRVYPIRALKNFQVNAAGETKYIYKGDLGGYVSGSHNLSQEGNCWITSAACVTDMAFVKDDAVVTDHATVSDDSVIYGNALIADRAEISGHSLISETATVWGHAKVAGAHVGENATVQDYVHVSNNSEIVGNAIVGGHFDIDSSYISSPLLYASLARRVSIIMGNIEDVNDFFMLNGANDNSEFIVFYRNTLSANPRLDYFTMVIHEKDKPPVKLRLDKAEDYISNNGYSSDLVLLVHYAISRFKRTHNF